MRKLFEQDLIESNYIHKPLRIHEEEMRETRCLKKKPIRSVLLDDMTSLDHWETVGEYAHMELSKEHTRTCEKAGSLAQRLRTDLHGAEGDTEGGS